MVNKAELQDFLFRYCEVQTYENAQSRYDYQMSFLRSLYDRISFNQGEYCELSTLMDILKPIFKDVKESNFKLLIKILEDTVEFDHP